MGLSAKVFVVLLLLLVATVALARDCESDSHKFHGACFSDTNCANVCQTEGFTAGKCVGVQRHCHCTKDC
ncbi:hypothetical protein CFC21_037735 [Triticum aestivum]|uniref:Knottins-like domain-containing protein n=2 Tax=Triticum aestivum TaxID=4565 RepID=A0A9R1JQ29_WHEAT|nr:hypothetical protein CFC21_037735 [Triticum aestivum]